MVVVLVRAEGRGSGASSGRPVQAGQGVAAQLEVPQVEERGGGVPSAGAGAESGTGSGTGPEDGKHLIITWSRWMPVLPLRGPGGGGSYLGLGPALNFLVLPGVLVVLVLGALVWSPSRSCSDDSS